MPLPLRAATDSVVLIRRKSSLLASDNDSIVSLCGSLPPTPSFWARCVAWLRNGS